MHAAQARRCTCWMTKGEQAAAQWGLMCYRTRNRQGHAIQHMKGSNTSLLLRAALIERVGVSMLRLQRYIMMLLMLR